ncbi:MAG: hypothetical protein HRU72_03190 [Planctomycetia bacterium]|nr:MAG: hypothetical protein HRU72_03190 [Planctomycetia bacterium]
MIKHGQTEFVHATRRRGFVSASHAWKWFGVNRCDGKWNIALAVDEMHL